MIDRANYKRFSGGFQRLEEAFHGARVDLSKQLLVVGEATAEVQRHVAMCRRPAKEHDLRRVVTNQLSAVRSVMAGTSIALDFTVQGERRPLTPEVEKTALRVGRKAVLNVLKHADARRVEVRLEYSSRLLTLQIRDDGRGISVGTAEAAAMDGHLGISGMRARAQRAGGTIDIASGPSRGTTVRLSLPV